MNDDRIDIDEDSRTFTVETSDEALEAEGGDGVKGPGTMGNHTCWGICLG